MNKKIFLSIILLLLTINSFAQEESMTGADVIDIGLVIDKSGSMRYNDPHNMRIDAGILLLNLLNLADNMAITAFGEGAKRITSLMEIEIAEDELQRAIQSIESRDRFSMIKEGLTEIFSVMKERSTIHPAVVIVLTDGEFQEDDLPPGTDLNTYFYELNKLSQEFENYNIPIYTVAFTQQANIEVLSNIARQSGGASYRAVQASDIQKVYTDILQNIRAYYSKRIGPEYLTGTEKTFAIKVTPGVEQLIITIFKESVEDPQPQITLFDPQGNQIDGEISSTSSYYMAKIYNPSQGEWEARINGRGRVEINFIEKIGVETEVLEPRSDELSKALGDELLIFVQIRPESEEVSIEDFEAEAIITRPDRSTEIIPLRDDGQNPDEVEGDGIFSGKYERLDKEGRYPLSIRIYPRENKEIVREIKEELAVKFMPDFTLETKSFLNVDEPIFIYAKIEPEVYENRGVILKSINGEIFLPGKKIESAQLLDNGNEESQGDQMAGDNLYSAKFRKIDKEGIYTAAAKALFEIIGGEVFTREKKSKVYKLVEVEESNFKIEREKEKVCEFRIRYYGENDANLRVIGAQFEPGDYFSIRGLQDSFILKARSEGIVKIAFRPTSLTNPGDDYKGKAIMEAAIPNIEGKPKIIIPMKIHIISWWDRNWYYSLIVAGVIVIFSIILTSRLVTAPSFPSSANLVVLDDSGLEIGRYKLRRYQKFSKKNIIVSKNLKIKGVPDKAFKLNIKRDGKVYIEAIKKKIRFSEEDVISLGKSRSLHSMDEFYIDGIKLRYEI